MQVIVGITVLSATNPIHPGSPLHNPKHPIWADFCNKVYPYIISMIWNNLVVICREVGHSNPVRLRLNTPYAINDDLIMGLDKWTYITWYHFLVIFQWHLLVKWIPMPNIFTWLTANIARPRRNYIKHRLMEHSNHSNKTNNIPSNL